MKRLVVCCDGTWQRLESPFPTDVERIAQAVKSQASDGVAQIIYYHEGIGTWDRIDKLLGGAFGLGIDQHIQLAHLFLALNYDPGIPWLQIDKFANDRLRFHDTTISGIVRHALHACAIDERRQPFDVTPMMRNWTVKDQSVEQMWFVGDHGCIGGGDPEKVELSNITLHWMITRAKKLGLGLELDFSAPTRGQKERLPKRFQARHRISLSTNWLYQSND